MKYSIIWLWGRTNNVSELSTPTWSLLQRDWRQWMIQAASINANFWLSIEAKVERLISSWELIDVVGLSASICLQEVLVELSGTEGSIASNIGCINNHSHGALRWISFFFICQRIDGRRTTVSSDRSMQSNDCREDRWRKDRVAGEPLTSSRVWWSIEFLQ